MGNACSLGAVNAPKRGEWPRPPKQKTCLQCGKGLLIHKKGNRDKKFCDTHCSTAYNMGLRLAGFRHRSAIIERCLLCHAGLMIPSAASAGMLGVPRSYVLRARRRLGAVDAREVARAASRACHIRRGTRGSEGQREARAMAWGWEQEWRGVEECYYAWWGWQWVRRGIRRRARWRERYKVDAAFTAKRMLRNQAARIKRKTFWSKRTNELLGCTYAEARAWLESQF